MDIRIQQLQLPASIKGFVHKDIDDYYTITINECMSEEAKLKTLNHELEHISREDFESEAHCTELEARCRE